MNPMPQIIAYVNTLDRFHDLMASTCFLVRAVNTPPDPGPSPGGAEQGNSPDRLTNWFAMERTRYTATIGRHVTTNRPRAQSRWSPYFFRTRSMTCSAFLDRSSELVLTTKKTADATNDARVRAARASMMPPAAPAREVVTHIPKRIRIQTAPKLSTSLSLAPSDLRNVQKKLRKSAAKPTRTGPTQSMNPAEHSAYTSTQLLLHPSGNRRYSSSPSLTTEKHVPPLPSPQSGWSV
mmetsp:Transcript_9540/g.20581  ORF Transcript_9540/g.20581 Transcript_9540/m.20581 type:complete len:236 (-) Transcript_9540:344-1051(-)